MGGKKINILMQLTNCLVASEQKAQKLQTSCRDETLARRQESVRIELFTTIHPTAPWVM